MSDDRTQGQRSRIVVLVILTALLLIVVAGVYLYLQVGLEQPGPLAPEDEERFLARQQERLLSLLLLLVLSALLILLFVLGTYLVLRAGQMLLRNRVGGRPTEYVDAWSQYRLTDEQISAAAPQEGGEDAPDGDAEGEDDDGADEDEGEEDGFPPDEPQRPG